MRNRHATITRSPRSLVAALGLVVTAGLLTSGPAEAHVFTRNDANDSASRIDLRSASVSHTSTSVVHKVRTWNSWTPASLQHDSFFLIGINKDGDPAYERCAFIYYTSRLRGQLSNCRTQFIRFLPVAKVNATTARITIPRTLLTPAYRWFARSLWVGAAPCRNGCNDLAPNALPDLLHDLTPPAIAMSPEMLAVWDDSTMPNFVFPFTVNDVHTGVTWSVQNRPLGTTSWTTVSTGSGEGPQDPSFTNVSAGHYQYRVVAIDSQGNKKISHARTVYVPTDVDADTGPGTSTGGVDTLDSNAYGGSYVLFNELSDTYSITVDRPGGVCRDFIVIGPGTGDWTIQISDGTNSVTRSHDQFADEPRESIYTESICENGTRTITITAGTDGAVGFGIDAVLL